MSTMDELTRLQRWWLANIDGDWEHGSGIRISTLDNPGWRVSINVKMPSQHPFEIARIEVERSEHDWYHCWTESGMFEGAGGPENLRDILRVFLDAALLPP